jgi:uroporphyrinogen-III synthase
MAEPMTKERPTLLMTRPAAASQATLRHWADILPADWTILVSPLMEIAPIANVPDLSGARGVIFTSAQGVECGGPASEIPAYCVGPRTAAVARDAGWIVARVAPDAETLLGVLLADPPPGPLVHIAGRHRRGAVAERLGEAGLPMRVVEVYDQRPLPLTPEAERALRGSAPVIVPLFSPRSARRFSDLAPSGAPLHVIAMSDAVLAETTGLGAVSRTVAPHPDGAGMISALSGLVRRVEAGEAPQ